VKLAIYPPIPLDIVIISALLIALLLPLIIAPRKYLSLIKLLRPFRLIHYAGFAAGGVVMGAKIGGTALDIYQFFYVSFAVLIAFQGAVFLNDIFDAEIDILAGKQTPFSKGIISIKHSYILAFGLTFLALGLLLRCGLTSFLIAILAYLLSLSYTVPPVRAKRFFPLNVFLLALTGLCIMLMGFAAQTSVFNFPIRMLVLVLLTLTATFGTKDMADIKGDRERGITTLFTLLGLQKGKKVNAILVLAAYLSTPLILAYPKLYFAAIPAAVLSAGVILAKKLREWLILLVYILFGGWILFLIVSGELF